MKKIVAFCVFALLCLSFYTHRISCDLQAAKKIKAMEIVGLMESRSRPVETYVRLETRMLPEPTDTKGADVLERIRMLKEHLAYDPSPEWIREVVTESELEIERLRAR